MAILLGTLAITWAMALHHSWHQAKAKPQTHQQVRSWLLSASRDYWLNFGLWIAGAGLLALSQILK
jgi:hypothetical protein